MEMLDAWIDEYLRVVVRTRPWTKRREQEALTQFAEWMRIEGGDPRTMVGMDWNHLVHRCGAGRELDADARNRLRCAVRNFTLWASAEGHLATSTE